MVLVAFEVIFMVNLNDFYSPCKEAIVVYICCLEICYPLYISVSMGMSLVLVWVHNCGNGPYPFSILLQQLSPNALNWQLHVALKVHNITNLVPM